MISQRSAQAHDALRMGRVAIPDTGGNNLGATRGPIRFELVRGDGKWDKKNRTSLELCPGLTCQDLSRKRSSFLLKQKSNWKRITLLACSFYGCDSEYWPVIIDNPRSRDSGVLL